MNAAPKYVAVTENVPRAGTILMWTLRGVTDLQALREEWTYRDLPEEGLPAPPSKSAAFRRAVLSLQTKTRIVRRLSHQEGDCYAIVDVNENKEDLQFQVSARATLLKDEILFEGNSTELELEFITANGKFASELATEDISAWLVRMIPRLDGVPMRASGGVYFIPAPSLEELDKIVASLKAATDHAVYRIPAMRGEDAVAAILDAVEEEARAEFDGMMKDIADSRCGKRGYENRVARCDLVEQKVARYETLLGGKIGGFRERLEELRASLTMAILQDSAEETAS